MADGVAQGDGSRRIYVIHTWPPCFRCRVIVLDPRAGRPEPGEQPTDIVSGLVNGVGPDTILAEFDWNDRPPAEETLATVPSIYCIGPPNDGSVFRNGHQIDLAGC